MPYLSYCIHVWGKAYDTHLRLLMSLQNRVARIIAGVPPRTHVESMYADLNTMPIKKMYLYTVGLFMYKFNNDMLLEMFVDMFTHVSMIHDRNTRQSARNHLYVPLYTTSRSQKCISYTGPRTWNFILSKINPHAPIGSFKNNWRALFNECSLLNILLWYCVTMWCPYVLFHCTFIHVITMTPYAVLPLFATRFRCMYWGHLGHFHRAISHLKWHKIVFIRYLAHTLVRWNLLTLNKLSWFN